MTFSSHENSMTFTTTMKNALKSPVTNLIHSENGPIDEGNCFPKQTFTMHESRWASKNHLSNNHSCFSRQSSSITQAAVAYISPQCPADTPPT